MQKIENMGFKRGTDVEVKRRLLMSVEGFPGSGKTSFLCTAPKPMVIFEFDVGLEGVIENRFADKAEDIHIVEFDTPNFFEAAQVGEFDYTESWRKFVRLYKSVLDSDARTISIDTGTEMYELQRMCRLSKLTEVSPQHYGPVNAEFRELLRLANNSNKNLILTHKMKDEYVGKHRSGKAVRSGFGGIEYDMHVLASICREGTEFSLKINKCRQNLNVIDMELEGPMCSFPFLASLVFPDSKLDDWE